MIFLMIASSNTKTGRKKGLPREKKSCRKKLKIDSMKMTVRIRSVVTGSWSSTECQGLLLPLSWHCFSLAICWEWKFTDYLHSWKSLYQEKKKTLQIGGSQQWFGIWYSNAWTKLGDRFGSELFDTASINNRTATDLRPNSQQLCDEGPLSLYKPFFSQRPRKIKSVERACVDPIRSSTKSDINPMVGHWASINRVFS